MNKEFGSLSLQEQQKLVEDVGECLKKHGLGDTPVTIYRENVCPLKAEKVDGRTTLKVEAVTNDDKVAEDCNKDIKKCIEGIQGTEIKVEKKVKAGDAYSPITKVQGLEGEEEMTIEHKQGQVLLIDFWATWCPPCQAPMAHNQSMLDKKGEAWKDKIKIIGISIDQNKETLKNHIETKKWTSPEHYFKGESDCSDVYGVRGVPHVMLIDTKGNIAFKGHPASRPNLEEDMENLLKGQTITGEGCAQSEKPKETADGKSDLDYAKCMKEVDDFTQIGLDLQKNDALKDSKLVRAFCVLCLNKTYIPNTGKSSCKFENYRVLVGPQADIDTAKALLEEKVKGSFELVLREQAF